MTEPTYNFDEYGGGIEYRLFAAKRAYYFWNVIDFPELERRIDVILAEAAA